MKKLVVVGIIFLFIGMSIPSTGELMLGDDTTPPETIPKLNPPDPDGDNAWYISDVTITLVASDDISGVNVTYYRINSVEWMEYIEPVLISNDGNCFFEYYSVDNAGNEEDVNSFTIHIDKTKPEIEFFWDYFKKGGLFHIKFIAICNDNTSGIDRTELYINNGLVEIDNEEPFVFLFEWSSIFHYVIFKAVAIDQAGNSGYDDYPHRAPGRSVTGLIFNPKVSDQNITFFAILVRYSIDMSVGYLVPGIPESYLRSFERITIPNDYEGYIGRFFIRANFYDWW